MPLAKLPISTCLLGAKLVAGSSTARASNCAPAWLLIDPQAMITSPLNLKGHILRVVLNTWLVKNAEGAITLSSLEKNPNSTTYNLTQKNNRMYTSQRGRNLKSKQNESWPAPKSSNSNMVSNTQSSGLRNTSLITKCQIVAVNLFHNIF